MSGDYMCFSILRTRAARLSYCTQTPMENMRILGTLRGMNFENRCGALLCNNIFGHAGSVPAVQHNSDRVEEGTQGPTT